LLDCKFSAILIQNNPVAEDSAFTSYFFNAKIKLEYNMF